MAESLFLLGVVALVGCGVVVRIGMTAHSLTDRPGPAHIGA